jgi:hypothetical protein
MEPSELLAYLIGIFDRLDLDYFITGSVAASYYGEPRFTNDIDVIVELTAPDVSKFCQSFPTEDFYVSHEAVRTAIRERRQFNILHPATGLKVDVFVLKDTPFDQSRISRRQHLNVEEGRTAWFASPEDVILKKLAYYKEGGSEKHIRDILGVLKIQGNSIDLGYLAHWAGELGLLDLWQDVLAQA